ncbi:polyphosphoinositide phosphatase-like [Convolutriloba macropyga]|uniref:polyphosphoinositide phosphatase-like n=1 Tax=Convolutriloba macropyga TaxID=536237 RepID=UPI003F5206F8
MENESTFRWDFRKQQMISSRVQKLELIEYSHLYLCVGSNEEDTQFWFMKIYKHQPEFEISYTSHALTKTEKEETLKMMEGDPSKGGIYRKKTLIQCFGIVGFVRFVGPYYMIAITKKSRVANIGPYAIYKIDGVQMIPLGSLPKDSTLAALEERYKKLFQSVDLTVNFYFSYSYDLTQTLQYNLTPIESKTTNKCENILGFRQRPRDKYMWNAFLLEPMLNSGLSKEQVDKLECLNINSQNHDWVLCVIHGFVSQMKMQIGGTTQRYDKPDESSTLRKFSSEFALNELYPRETKRSMLLTVIARRSRCYAGTRFNKRGANCQGDVANEVELEQLVADYIPSSFKDGRFSSFVQIRGSVPLLWSQTAPSTKNLSFKTKPEIRFDCADPCYITSGRHFMSLLSQYGSPVIVFNLVKKRKKHQETRLTAEFRKAIDYLNQFIPVEHKLRYFHLDMSALSKQKGDSTLDQIIHGAKDMVDMCGIFYTGKKSSKVEDQSYTHNEAPDKQLQTGIVRVNCVDCLDRTNTAQFALGLVALGKQLAALEVTNRTELGYDMHCVRMLEELYDSLGDTIALQYGSSYLVHRIEGYRRKYHSHNPGTRLTPTVQSISRYYNNTFSDKEKQEAINVFLGIYRPSEHHLTKPAVSVLATVRPLPNSGVQNFVGQTMPKGGIRYVSLERPAVVKTDDSLHGLRSLPLWDMESDYGLHHVFDTSKNLTTKANFRWFQPEVINCLPYAANEVYKSENSCEVLKFWSRGDNPDFNHYSESRLMKLDPERMARLAPIGNQFFDWYLQFYRPFRITFFDVLLKLNKHFLTVDRLKLPPDTIRGLNFDYFKSSSVKYGSLVALPDIRSSHIENGNNSAESSILTADEFTHIEADESNDDENSRSRNQENRKKNFGSLMDTFVFPLFNHSSSRTSAVFDFELKRESRDNYLSCSNSNLEETEMYDNFMEFPKFGKQPKSKSKIPSKKSSNVVISNESYGLEVREPSSSCKAAYEKYISMGQKSGMYPAPNKTQSEPTNFGARQFQPRANAKCPSTKSAILNATLVDDKDTPSSMFKDNKWNFTPGNSSEREVFLSKPSARDSEIYRNYVQLGKYGAESALPDSRRKHEEYIRQKYQYPPTVR